MSETHVCPSCGDKGAVVDSRPSPVGLRRRRTCKACKKRWTTIEVGVGEGTGERGVAVVGPQSKELILAPGASINLRLVRGREGPGNRKDIARLVVDKEGRCWLFTAGSTASIHWKS